MNLFSLFTRLRPARCRPRGCCWLGLALGLLGPLAAKDQWMKVGAPHFTILTDDSVGDARDWAVSLEAFREHLQTIVPTDDRMLDPMTLVVFKAPRAFRAITGPLDHADPLMVSTGRFISRDGRFLGAVNPEDEDGARHSIFLQASVWLTRSSRFPLPVWLVTGLQQIYTDHTITGGEMLIGHAEEGCAKSLENGLRLPLSDMFSMTTHSPAYKATDGYFNAQAWAFGHFMLLGDKGANRAALARYLEAVVRGDALVESERRLYPQGLPELSERFTRYVKTGAYRMEALPIPLAPIAARLVVAPATDGEVQAALGYLALHFQGVAAATPYFERLEELKPKSPATLEALAELAKFRGDQAEQVRYCQEAVRAGSTFYLAHFYAYYPAAQGFFGSEAGADATDVAAARQAVEGVKKLLRLRPGFHDGYETMAGLMGSLGSANDDDEAVLKEGRRYFPDDAVLESGQVAYEILTRRFVDAKARLDRVFGGDLANSGRAMLYAEKLRVRLRAANSLYWLEKFSAAEDFENLDKLMPQFNGAPLRREERERLLAVRANLSAWATIGMVRTAMERRDWDSAEVLLSGIVADKLSGKLRTEVIALAGQIAAGKKHG